MVVFLVWVVLAFSVQGVSFKKPASLLPRPLAPANLSLVQVQTYEVKHIWEGCVQFDAYYGIIAFHAGAIVGIDAVITKEETYFATSLDIRGSLGGALTVGLGSAQASFVLQVEIITHLLLRPKLWETSKEVLLGSILGNVLGDYLGEKIIVQDEKIKAVHKARNEVGAAELSDNDLLASICEFLTLVIEHFGTHLGQSDVYQKIRQSKTQYDTYLDEFETVFRRDLFHWTNYEETNPTIEMFQKFFKCGAKTKAAVSKVGGFPYCSPFQKGKEFLSLLCVILSNGYALPHESAPSECTDYTKNFRSSLSKLFKPLFPFDKTKTLDLNKFAAISTRTPSTIKTITGKVINKFFKIFLMMTTDTKELQDIKNAKDENAKKYPWTEIEVTLRATLSATVGSSHVGFCTADNNIFQANALFETKYDSKIKKWEYQGTQLAVTVVIPEFLYLTLSKTLHLPEGDRWGLSIKFRFPYEIPDEFDLAKVENEQTLDSINLQKQVKQFRDFWAPWIYGNTDLENIVNFEVEKLQDWLKQKGQDLTTVFSDNGVVHLVHIAQERRPDLVVPDYFHQTIPGEHAKTFAEWLTTTFTTKIMQKAADSIMPVSVYQEKKWGFDIDLTYEKGEWSGVFKIVKTSVIGVTVKVPAAASAATGGLTCGVQGYLTETTAYQYGGEMGKPTSLPRLRNGA